MVVSRGGGGGGLGDEASGGLDPAPVEHECPGEELGLYSGGSRGPQRALEQESNMGRDALWEGPAHGGTQTTAWTLSQPPQHVHFYLLCFFSL